MSKTSVLKMLVLGATLPLLLHLAAGLPGSQLATAQESLGRLATPNPVDRPRDQIARRRAQALQRLALLRERIDLIEKEINSLNVDQLTSNPGDGTRRSTTAKSGKADDSQPQAFIIGNSPYYQVMHDMAKKQGWKDRMSFNVDYAKYLPKAKGHILLIESHNGVPIVPVDELDAVFPGASKKLRASEKVHIDGTELIRVEFSGLLPQGDTAASGFGR